MRVMMMLSYTSLSSLCKTLASKFHDSADDVDHRFIICHLHLCLIPDVVFIKIIIMIIFRNITIQDPQYSYGMGVIMGSEELPMTNITFDGVVINIVN